MRQGAVPPPVSGFTPRPPPPPGGAGVPLAQTPPNVPARSLQPAGLPSPRSLPPVPPAPPAEGAPASSRRTAPCVSASIFPQPCPAARRLCPPPILSAPGQFLPPRGSEDTKGWGPLRTLPAVSLCAQGLHGFDLFVLSCGCDFILSFTVKAICFGSHWWSGSLGTGLLPWSGTTLLSPNLSYAKGL